MLKPNLLDRLLVEAAQNKQLVDLRSVITAQYVNGRLDDLPKYVDVTVTVNSESVITRLRNDISKTLVARYHDDISQGNLPLAALFVGEKTKAPGPPLRQLMEQTRGQPFKSEDEWITHWENLVHAIYASYDKGA